MKVASSVLRIGAASSSLGRPGAPQGSGFALTLRGEGNNRGCHDSHAAAFATLPPSSATAVRSSSNRAVQANPPPWPAAVVMTTHVLPPGGGSTAGIGNDNTGRTSSAPTKSFYRRTLKPPCIAFSSGEGRRLFREALVDGTMESYFRLAEQFRTQDEPAFCGLSTLTMVLNALAVDPGRVWKGPWRWYHESMLDCCAPLDTVKDKGITMSTLACLARCNGLSVKMGGPDTGSIDDLRAVVEVCSSEDRGKVVVVSYDRRGLNQSGTGHFSPIGGYHRSQDAVLIMDTARFKLPPHWVPLAVLWGAMKTPDPETGKARGYMVLEKAHSLSHRLFTANSRNYKDWPKVATWVNEMIELASGAPPQRHGGEEREGEGEGEYWSGDDGRDLRDATTVAEFVSPLLALLRPEVVRLLTTFNSAGQAVQGKLQDGVILQAIQGTEVYQEIMRMEREGCALPGRSASISSDAGGRGGSMPGIATVDNPDPVGDGGGPLETQDQDRPLAASYPPRTSSSALSPPPGSDPFSASLSTSTSTSTSTSCLEATCCGCSSRHGVSVLTYALLLLLHKRDHEAGGGADDRVGPGRHRRGGGFVEPVWREDPLRLLPLAVADEVKHVAGMLGGLVEMEECEKCAAP